MVDNTAPIDLLTIDFEGKPRELFMSFGLLHELIPIVGDLTNVGMIAINTELRVNVLNAVLAARDDHGRIAEPLDVFNLKISAKDFQRLVHWVQEHLLDFFIGAIESATEAHKPHLDRLQTPWTLSGNGSPA